MLNQLVEKVVVGPVGSLKQARNMHKTGLSAPERGSEKGTKEFFNTLVT
jgi:hypothetical protein